MTLDEGAGVRADGLYDAPGDVSAYVDDNCSSAPGTVNYCFR